MARWLTTSSCGWTWIEAEGLESKHPGDRQYEEQLSGF